MFKSFAYEFKRLFIPNVIFCFLKNYSKNNFKYFGVTKTDKTISVFFPNQPTEGTRDILND